jgi:type IV secretion system protein VirB6
MAAIEQATENYIYDDIFNYTDSVTTKYFTDGAASTAGAFHNTAYVLLTIYVIMYGLMLLFGRVQEPIMDGVARIIKASFIVTFAIDSSLYASEIATFLYEWPTALGSALSGSQVATTSQLIGKIVGAGLDLTSKAWETASFRNMGGYAIALVLFLVTIIVTAITATIIISSKFSLALLLALGPLFILMMLFDATRKFFDWWLSSCIAAGFTIVLVSSAASLIFTYYDSTFQAVSKNVAKNAGIVTIGDITIPAILGVIGIIAIPGMVVLAGGLSGGVSTASAGAASWAYNKIKGVTPSPLQVGKAGYGAGKALFNKTRNGAGRGGQGNSIQGAPKSIYRRITRSSGARAN